ncbi:MAG TPA: hypothetical protein DD420_35230 [Streptomyces sp.]|nr:hypothetical protein [Streptomyces sp.]
MDVSASSVSWTPYWSDGETVTWARRAARSAHPLGVDPPASCAPEAPAEGERSVWKPLLRVAFRHVRNAENALIL